MPQGAATDRQEDTVNHPIATYVRGMDPIAQAGVVSQLRTCREVSVVGEAARSSAAVAVVVADQVDHATTRPCRRRPRPG